MLFNFHIFINLIVLYAFECIGNRPRVQNVSTVYYIYLFIYHIRVCVRYESRRLYIRIPLLFASEFHKRIIEYKYYIIKNYETKRFLYIIMIIFSSQIFDQFIKLILSTHELYEKR